MFSLLKKSKLFYLVFIISCQQQASDNDILEFINKNDIAFSLNIEREIYIANSIENLYYINFKYYQFDRANSQWQWSYNYNSNWHYIIDSKLLPFGLIP